MNEEIKNLETKKVDQRFQSIYKMIVSYCLKCRKNTESKNPKDARTKTEIMLLSNRAVFDSKRLRIVQFQQNY